MTAVTKTCQIFQSFHIDAIRIIDTGNTSILENVGMHVQVIMMTEVCFPFHAIVVSL